MKWLHGGFCFYRFLPQEAQAANREPGKSCGIFTAASKQIREEGRDLLDVGCLLYISLRAEHRENCAVRYGTAMQKFSMTTGASFWQQIQCLRRMRQWSAACQGLLGVVRIWSLILSFYEPRDGRVTGIPREERVRKDDLHAFLQTLAWKCAGKEYPRSTGILLELLRGGTFRGLQTELKRGCFHLL